MSGLPPRPNFPPPPSILGKRKTPTPSPGVKVELQQPAYTKVKTEEQDIKRQKSGFRISRDSSLSLIPDIKPVLSASHGAFKDVRTSAASMVSHLKVGLYSPSIGFAFTRYSHEDSDLNLLLSWQKSSLISTSL